MCPWFPTNAPTPEAAQSLPTDLECPSEERITKTIVIIHDESTFQANNDQLKFWGTKDMTLLGPKSKGAVWPGKEYLMVFNLGVPKELM